MKNQYFYAIKKLDVFYHFLQVTYLMTYQKTTAKRLINTDIEREIQIPLSPQTQVHLFK